MRSLRLASGIAIAGLLTGSLASPQAANQPARLVTTSQPLGGPGPLQCPDGSSPIPTMSSACFPNPPAVCGDVERLDWGTIAPEQVFVPKFDPNLGTLLGVEVNYKIRFTGDICLDNTMNTCCFVDIKPRVLMTMDPNPAIPGLTTAVIDETVVILPTDPFFLGDADGFDDCAIPNQTMGPMSNGACPNPGDHFATVWDEMRQDGPHSLSTPAELAPWINTLGGPPEFVTFDGTARGLFTGGGCTNMNFIINSFAGVEVEATYIYCPNAAPVCVMPAQPYEVNENPVVASNSVAINLMDLVTDIDGCIDCNTFQITQQPMFAGALSTSCTGAGTSFGDLFNPDVACTACTSCTVTYTPTVGIDFCGMDIFKFTVMDDDGALIECDVAVTVNPVNEPPVCVSGPVLPGASEGQTVVVDLRPYVSDPDDGPDGVGGLSENCGWGLNLASMTATSSCGGTLVPVAAMPGTFRFTAPTNFCGTCTISFNVCDFGPGPEQLCIDPPGPQCTVQIPILPVNQPPICISGPALPSVFEGETTGNINFCQYFSDPDDVDGCGAGFDCTTVVPMSSCGTFTPVAGQRGVFRFTAPNDFCGPCNITVMGCDLAGACVVAPCPLVIQVLPKNERPICVGGPPLPNVVEGETTGPINFCQYVSDPDDLDGCGAGINCASIVPTSNCGGTFTPVNGMPGFFTFKAPVDFCGTCTITFSACDSGSPPLCVVTPCQLTIEVLPKNEAPFCIPGPALPPLMAGQTSGPIDFCQYVTDPDDADGCGHGIDCSSIVPTSLCGGTFTPVAGQPGVFTFTAPNNFCGPCNLRFFACDLGTPGVDRLCTSPQCLIPIDIVMENQRPECVNGPAIPCVPEDGIRQIDFKLYVKDDDDATGCGPGLDVNSITPTASCGELINLGNGVFNFVPPPNFCGTCQITFTACDLGAGAAKLCLLAPCVLNVEVCGVNDPPVAMNDNATTTPGNPVIIDLCGNDTDVDDLSLGQCGCPLDCSSIVIISGEDSPCGTLKRVDPNNANGDFRWVFTPADGFVDDQCCFTYRIWDRDPVTGLVCDFDDAQVCITVLPCLDTNHRNPSSLLLYPEFDNRPGMMTIHTVTNVSKTVPTWVKMYYVDEEDCSRSDRAEFLSPNDTFTFITNSYIADQIRGFAYMYAQCGQTGMPVDFNNLIGNMFVMDGFNAIAYGVNPVGFRAVENLMAPLTPCGLRTTELTGDNIRNLDNLEYEPAPDRLLIPRFLGQTDTRVSELILINLTGGVQFTTTVDFLIYNDNEEEFSSQFTFYCWEKVPLLSISNVFNNSYLQMFTDQDIEEVFGEPTMESGWMKLDGRVANSTSTSIANPAIYALLIESTAPKEKAADLPWSEGCQNNAGLLPNSLHGQF